MELKVQIGIWTHCMVPSKLVVAKGISDGAKVTYAALVIWGQKNGEAWASRQRVAEARGIGVRSLQGHIARLVETGWLRRHYDQKNGRVVLTVVDSQIRAGGANPCEGGADRAPIEVQPVAPEVDKGRKEEVEDVQFTEWWAEVPRREAKKDARKAFKAALRSVDLPTLLERTKAWAKAMREERREKRHILLPASFLRSERWEDAWGEKGDPKAPAYDAEADERRVRATRRAMREVYGPRGDGPSLVGDPSEELL